MTDETTPTLTTDIDDWHNRESSHRLAAVPDFWDELDTSARLAAFLAERGWRKVDGDLGK